MLPVISHLFRISRPLELKYSQAGNAFGNVGLVCSEKYKEKETTLWMNATAFGKTAELINTMPKGAQIFIKGKISTDQWVSKTGEKKQATQMTIDTFQFVDKKEIGSQYDNVDRQGQHNVAGGMNRPTDEQRHNSTPTPELPVVDVDEEEIPFGYIGLSEGGYYEHLI